MGLEPMTSPLPRECSTTELHQPSTKTFLSSSYRERRPRASRCGTANNASTISTMVRTLSALHREPGQHHQRQPTAARSPPASSASRTHRPSAIATELLQISGAQGRIRTSVARKERQIYSLLPLTTRPPVHNFFDPSQIQPQILIAFNR